MKILHISDLHFGKRLNNFSLLEDQYHVNRQIFKLAKDTHIEAVIIAGDVFDRQIPLRIALIFGLKVSVVVRG